jgi:hypothetical protein
MAVASMVAQVVSLLVEAERDLQPSAAEPDHERLASD